MVWKAGRVRRPLTPLAATAAALVALAAGCGESTVKAEGAEQAVVDVVSGESGFQPDDVSCPSDVEAEEGTTFECTFTGPEGPYVVDMEITEVDGERVNFDVTARRDR